MSIKSAQRRVPRPLIARHGGTHKVDLAVGGDTATHGMTEMYSSEDEHGDRETTYRPPSDRAMSPLASFAYGAGEVIVEDRAVVDDEAYLNDDVQPEVSEADGENQDAGGTQEEVPRGYRSAGSNPRYGRRGGGIG